MKIEKISTRNILFVDKFDGWDLNIHLIRGQHNNYLIDTGRGSKSVQPILDYLGEDQKPIVIIITHHHWDHIWGNHCFDSSLIIAHSSCPGMIEKTWETDLECNKRWIAGVAKKKLPNLLFDNSLSFPEDKIHIFHAPGHTIDSISVYDEAEKILNVGDNIGDDMIEILPNLECEKYEYQQSIELYKNLDIEYVVSGHNQTLRSGIFDMIEKVLTVQPKLF